MGFTEWAQRERNRLAAASRVVETAKGPMELAELGAGMPFLVLHGRPGGYDQGILIAKAIGEGLGWWLAVSRPGYLRTPLATGGTPAEQADAYAALLDALGTSKAVVFALSGGGPSALEFARRHLERCRGLVLVSTVTRRKLPSERPGGQRLLDWICESDRLAYALYRVFGPITGREALGTLLVLPASLRREGRLNDMEQFAKLGERPPEGIDTPTLIVHGQADRIVDIRHAEAASAIIPAAKLFEVRGAGHSVLFTHLRKVREAVTDFLRPLRDQ